MTAYQIQGKILNFHFVVWKTCIKIAGSPINVYQKQQETQKLKEVIQITASLLNTLDSSDISCTVNISTKRYEYSDTSANELPF